MSFFIFPISSDDESASIIIWNVCLFSSFWLQNTVRLRNELLFCMNGTWFFVYNDDDGHNDDDNMMNLSLFYFCHFFSFSLGRYLFLAFSVSFHSTTSCLVCGSETDFVDIVNAMLWPIVVNMIWKCGIYNWKKCVPAKLSLDKNVSISVGIFFLPLVFVSFACEKTCEIGILTDIHACIHAYEYFQHTKMPARLWVNWIPCPNSVYGENVIYLTKVNQVINMYLDLVRVLFFINFAIRPAQLTVQL